MVPNGLSAFTLLLLILVHYNYREIIVLFTATHVFDTVFADVESFFFSFFLILDGRKISLYISQKHSRSCELVEMSLGDFLPDLGL